MNQLPPTEQQTGKRIVSRGAYAVSVGKKVSGLSSGVLFVLLGTFAALAGISLALFSCLYPFVGNSPDWGSSDTGLSVMVLGVFEMVGLGVLGIFGVGSAVLIITGKKLLKGAKQLEPVVPLTRANIADLPAPESLVRASAQPVQEPQAVLLRAATETQATPPEQLVRASAGKE
jgi:hypothetical protein